MARTHTDRILFGAAYYDEYMPKDLDRVDEDMRMMKEAGINLIRIAESTWSTEEPQPGVFDFTHIDRALDAAQRAGSDVIVGTPTYAVPTWMVKMHPEVLAVTPAGPGKYGARQIMDIVNPTYRFYAERIIRRLIAHVADHPAVIGYQVDNETKYYDSVSPDMQALFVKYLREKFHDDLDELNARFGLDYWSNRINAWEDFPDVTATINQSLLGEFDRFRRALGEYYRQNPADDLPELTCDLRVNDPHLLTMPCIESLDALEPCGNGTPRPLLCITGARLVNAVPIGGGRHLRLHFAKGGYNYAGIFFSCTPAQLGVRIGQWVDVAFTPQLNEFRGRRSVQLLVTDVRPSDPLPLCRALLKNQCIPAWDTVDLYPLRADFAVAWRWLNAPVAFPLEELRARAPMRPEKFCVCLRVMAEMGLAAVDFDGETLRLRPLPTSCKVVLGASKLLQTLRERRQSLL